MKEIHLKILPEYFELLLQGKKKYELRLGDKDIQEGDTLVLEEWVGSGSERNPTGRVLRKRVSHTSNFSARDLETFWKKEDIESYGITIASLEDEQV